MRSSSIDKNHLSGTSKVPIWETESQVKWHIQSHTDYKRQGFQPSLHKKLAVLCLSLIHGLSL